MAARDDQDGSGIEKIERGYLGKVLQLTLLAPDVVEALVDGWRHVELSLSGMMEGVFALWNGQ